MKRILFAGGYGRRVDPYFAETLIREMFQRHGSFTLVATGVGGRNALSAARRMDVEWELLKCGDPPSQAEADAVMNVDVVVIFRGRGSDTVKLAAQAAGKPIMLADEFVEQKEAEIQRQARIGLSRQPAAGGPWF